MVVPRFLNVADEAPRVSTAVHSPHVNYMLVYYASEKKDPCWMNLLHWLCGSRFRFIYCF